MNDYGTYDDLDRQLEAEDIEERIKMAEKTEKALVEYQRRKDAVYQQQATQQAFMDALKAEGLDPQQWTELVNSADPQVLTEIFRGHVRNYVKDTKKVQRRRDASGRFVTESPQTQQRQRTTPSRLHEAERVQQITKDRSSGKKSSDAALTELIDVFFPPESWGF